MADLTLEEFLQPISQALSHDAVPDAPAGSYVADRGLARDEYAELSADELVARFVEEGQAIGLSTTVVEPDGLTEAIVAQVQAYGAGPVVYADDAKADACGLPEALAQASIAATRWDASRGQACVDACAAASTGIVFPFAAIARTATVALRCDERCGRAVSLLPPNSIAVVYRSELVAQMVDVLEALEVEGDGLPSSVVFSTGPSATSDIELVRVVGVHGPVRSSVVLVND